ncbi:MAG: putative RNA uridine N3 methyltransferase [Candidatus Nitrosocaldaceae archaeon]
MDIYVALPDSSLIDANTLIEKSRKVAILARIFAIFRVKKIIIYHDQSYHGYDGKILKLILEFMNTPPYLRRLVYKKMPELAYSGLFEPLNAPHHKPYKRLEDIKEGEVRQGIIIKKHGLPYAEVGLDQLIPIEGDYKEKGIINFIFTASYPNLKCRIARSEEIKEYWGYNIIFYNKLSRIMDRFDYVILTSRKGKLASKFEEEISRVVKDKERIVIVFGSTKHGVREILNMEDYDKPLKYIYNFFPYQGVITIRIEEAILGVLSILNHIIDKS